jgi:glutaminyl-tRNA synthetase
MGVVRPLKVVIENFPEGAEETFDAPWHPEYPDRGGRKLGLSRVIFVDRDDFAEVPPKGWFRLSPGAEVRLRYACIIRCERVIKNDAGDVIELRCTWDPESLGGQPKDGRKVKGTLHWVSEKRGVAAEVRLYERLFTTEQPGASADGGEPGDETERGDAFLADLNPESCTIVRGARVEAAIAASPTAGDRFQFERVGYFCVDPDSRPGAPVYNRTIGLRDSWAAKQGK